MVLPSSTSGKGEDLLTSFDAVPFGIPLDDEGGTVLGVKWAEPRKIRHVSLTVEPDQPYPDLKDLRIEYWHRAWDGKADTVVGEKNAGSVGWEAMDDWTNGSWRTIRANADGSGRSMSFSFPSTADSDFPDAGEHGVAYRKTIKLRVVSSKPLPKMTLRAITDAKTVPLTVRIQWGEPAAEDIEAADHHRGTLEIYNGHLQAIRPLDDAAEVTGKTFNAPMNSGIEADLTLAADPINTRYDDTVVTVRDGVHPFSFRADDIANGERILINDLGVLITRADDRITLEEYRQELQEFPGRSVYDRVFDMPEQTLERAWSLMPLKRPLYFVHGLPGNRNAFRQTPEGNVMFDVDERWFKLQPSDRDTHRRHWNGRLTLHFGLPEQTDHPRRALTDGYLPELRTWLTEGPIHYEQTTILDTLDGDLDAIRLDDPTALFARVRFVNTSEDQTGRATLRFASALEASESVTLENGRLVAQHEGQPAIRCLINANDRGSLIPAGDHVRYELDLPPGDAHTIFVTIPSITINAEEADALAKRRYADVSARVCRFWKAMVDRGTRITTSEPWLDDFYKAHLIHLMINSYKELDSDRLHAHVATLRYGVYPNESAMMISDLDRRGYHVEVRRHLDSYFHYQSTVPLPGNYTDHKGVFYGAGGHECCGYNKNHGYVLWLMAQHWWMTRDRAWMNDAAPKLVEACEWVMRQRRETMITRPDGSRPIEYGCLPAGSLEDVTDYWYWLSTNSATVWGLLDLANALADFGHPRGAEMQAEAKAFHGDFLASTRESMIRAPVVKLRDNTYIPKIPSRLYERGRSHGWIRETLEGSIFLPHYKLIDPSGPEARWILKDFEDNLYISEQFGYSIPAFDVFWFDRGGFSMQANLLDGPPTYLYRDEIKHYLRSFFNGFASAFYPELRMCNEHSLPELGFPAGDHFKSSDESQVTYWLRLMFIHERDGDLTLGQALPRKWLASGRTIGITDAPSCFGPLSWNVQMTEDGSSAHVELDPPTRTPPDTIYLRIRHPEEKPIRHVRRNGDAHDAFDVDKEWIILPGKLDGPCRIDVDY